MRTVTWTRTCDYCGRAARVIRRLGARPPRSVRCQDCGTEHPVIYPSTPAGAHLYFSRIVPGWVKTVR